MYEKDRFDDFLQWITENDNRTGIAVLVGLLVTLLSLILLG